MSQPLQLRVKIQDVSATDTLKLKKILQLSSTRQRQYVWSEEEADILVTANPTTQQQDNIPLLTLGPSENFPDSTAHIKPPLIGIRVLKALDALRIPTPAKKKTESAEAFIEPASSAPGVSTLDVVTPIAQTPEPSDETTKAHNILIVDDSAIIHKALQLELQQAHFSSAIDYADTGEQCLECIAKKNYDLIFLDVMMPGIDGYETCTEIRKNPVFKKTPVIMLSAKTSPLDEVKGIMAGCTTYLTKPIQHEDFQKLLSRMDKWLENYKTTR